MSARIFELASDGADIVGDNNSGLYDYTIFDKTSFYIHIIIITVSKQAFNEALDFHNHSKGIWLIATKLPSKCISFLGAGSPSIPAVLSLVVN